MGIASGTRASVYSRAGPSPYFHEFWGLPGLILALLGVHDAPPPPKTPPRATGFVAVLLRQLVGSSWGRYPLVIYWTCGSQNRGPRSEEDNLPRPIALEKLVKSEKRLAPLPPHSPQPNPMPKSTSLGALLNLLGSFWGRFGSVLGSFWAP